MSQLKKDVMIALDFSGKKEVMDFLDLFTEEKPFVKIGMELYYAEGPAIVREIKARGHKIFLDLKLHDIPNTVKKAMAVLSGLDVDMCNLHAAGTVAMMEGALAGLTRPDGTVKKGRKSWHYSNSYRKIALKKKRLENAETISKLSEKAKEQGHIHIVQIAGFGKPSNNNNNGTN